MNITWHNTGPIYRGISDEFSVYISLDFNNENGCIVCSFANYMSFIPFAFSQIPGEQNDPDLFVLAHQLIEKKIQTLKENGRY